MRKLFYLALTVVLVACGCTDEGCGNDLRFDLGDLSQWIESEDFSIETCVDGECTTIAVEDASQLGVSWIGFPTREPPTNETRVEITVTSGEMVKSASGLVELENHRPNGSFCAPVCSVADVTIDGSSLLNAEPGSFPPRD